MNGHFDGPLCPSPYSSYYRIHRSIDLQSIVAARWSRVLIDHT